MVRISLFGISLISFVIGLVILFISVNRGMDAANAYLQSHGGGMDTAQFVILLQEYIHTYQWIGGILSGIGGLGMVRAMELHVKEYIKPAG